MYSLLQDSTIYIPRTYIFLLMPCFLILYRSLSLSLSVSLSGSLFLSLPPNKVVGTSGMYVVFVAARHLVFTAFGLVVT